MKLTLIILAVLAMVASVLVGLLDVQFLNTRKVAMAAVDTHHSTAGSSSQVLDARQDLGRVVRDACDQWHARQWPLRVAIQGLLWAIVMICGVAAWRCEATTRIPSAEQGAAGNAR